MNAQMSENPQVQQLLSQLNGIVTIDTVSWWPLAPAWWVLGISSLVLVVFFIAYLIARYRRNRYRKMALKHLQTLSDIEAPAKYLVEVSSLLKRTAIAAYPQEKYHIISLYGEAWTDWLYQRVVRARLNNETQKALAQGLYKADVEYVKQDLHNFAKIWIKRHRLKAKQNRTAGLAHV